MPPSAHWFEAVPAFSAPRESFPPRGARRSLRLLSRWIGTLVKPVPAERDLHLVFCDGSTLCALIERLRPATKLVRFRKALTRGTALANIESALALVWQHAPQSCAMPSAEQVLCGQPRELMLRFISELYTVFVVRPARGRLPAALAWLDRILADAGRPLSPATLRPPHDRLGADLRGGAALALVLHAHLPPSRCAELAEVRWEPRSEEQRRASLRAVWAVLERERLAPCSALEFASAGRPPASASTASVDVCEERARPTFIGKEDAAVALQQSAYTQAAAAAGREQEHELCVVLAVALHARLAAVAPHRGPPLRFRDEGRGRLPPAPPSPAPAPPASRASPPAAGASAAAELLPALYGEVGEDFLRRWQPPAPPPSSHARDRTVLGAALPVTEAAADSPAAPPSAAPPFTPSTPSRVATPRRFDSRAAEAAALLAEVDAFLANGTAGGGAAAGDILRGEVESFLSKREEDTFLSNLSPRPAANGRREQLQERAGDVLAALAADYADSPAVTAPPPPPPPPPAVTTRSPSPLAGDVPVAEAVRTLRAPRAVHVELGGGAAAEAHVSLGLSAAAAGGGGGELAMVWRKEGLAVGEVPLRRVLTLARAGDKLCLLVRADGGGANGGAKPAEEEALHQLLELRLGTDAQCAHCYAALTTVHADLAGARRALDRALAVDVEAGAAELVDAARSLGLRDSVLAYPHSPPRLGSAALVDGVYRDMGLA